MNMNEDWLLCDDLGLWIRLGWGVGKKSTISDGMIVVK
jgi:hypothetical protein